MREVLVPCWAVERHANPDLEQTALLSKSSEVLGQIREPSDHAPPPECFKVPASRVPVAWVHAPRASTCTQRIAALSLPLAAGGGAHSARMDRIVLSSCQGSFQQPLAARSQPLSPQVEPEALQTPKLFTRCPPGRARHPSTSFRAFSH